MGLYCCCVKVLYPCGGRDSSQSAASFGEEKNWTVSPPMTLNLARKRTLYLIYLLCSVALIESNDHQSFAVSTE